MMTNKEKEVFDLFIKPKTFEDAYACSKFRGLGNFTSYVNKLKEKGLLTEFTRKKKSNLHNLVCIDTLIQAVKDTTGFYAGFCLSFIPAYFLIQFVR